jgi:LPS-assembly lipoprotein
MTRYLCIAALSLLLSGCGFHMASDRPLPESLSSVYIETVDFYRVSVPEIQTALQKAIASRGGLVKSRASDAKATLRLSALTQRQDALSINAFGFAVEYRVIVSVHYELVGGGKNLVPPDVITLSRDYSFNAQQIVAKDEEQARLTNYIEDQMAELLLLRLEAMLEHPPAG